MRKYLTLIFLSLSFLLASTVYAQDVGFFTRANCGTLSPVEDTTVCLQTTTTGGRTEGHVYVYTGGTWVDLVSASSGGHVIKDEGTARAQRTNLNFVGAGVSCIDDSGNDETECTINTASGTTFDAITSGTNTGAAMVVDSGASLAASGSGTIAATSAPFSGLSASTNTTSAMVVGTGASLAASGSGTISATTSAAVTSADLAAVEALACTGGAYRTASNTWTCRTITGTTNKITVSNGDGVAGVPTLTTGSLVVHTDQANTWSTGAQSFAGATSLAVPTSDGVAPTTSGLIAYDSSSHTLEYGANGTNRVVATAAQLAALNGTDIIFTPAFSIAATTVSAAIFETYAEKQGLDADLTVLAAHTASKIIDNSEAYCADAGGDDSYSCTNPAVVESGGPVTGATYWLKTPTTNTGAASVDFSVGGAKAIKKFESGSKADPATNDIPANAIIALTYDGTDMLLQSPLGNVGAGTMTGPLSTNNCLAKEDASSTNVTCSSIVDDGAGNITTGDISAGDYHQESFTDPNTTGGADVHIHTWPAVTGNVAQTTGSLATDNLGSFDSFDRIIDSGTTKWFKAYWSGGSLVADGTQCVTPSTPTVVNSGPADFYPVCADNAASILYGQVHLTRAITTVTFTATVSDDASSAHHWAGTFEAMCRATTTTINSTWGTGTTVDITMTTANILYTGTTAATTPNGTCSAGATLFWKWTAAAAGAHTDASARVIGIYMEQAS